MRTEAAPAEMDRRHAFQLWTVTVHLRNDGDGVRPAECAVTLRDRANGKVVGGFVEHVSGLNRFSFSADVGLSPEVEALEAAVDCELLGLPA